MPWGTIRTKWIVRFHIFRKTGSNFYFCPRKLPADPKLIEFGNNVAVATDVMFINHDVTQKVFNNMYENKLPKYFGCIRVGNNVFIGARATILPNTTICDNVFIAAGALVSKSITKPGIYGGVPAKYIGDMNELYEKRASEYKYLEARVDGNDLIQALWNNFDKKTKVV